MTPAALWSARGRLAVDEPSEALIFQFPRDSKEPRGRSAPPRQGGGPGSSAPGYRERRREERRVFTRFTRRRETAMKRMAGALGILGLVCAVAWPTAANAAVSTQVKLFGTTYNVTIFGRDQTYKRADGKQVKIVLQPADSY